MLAKTRTVILGLLFFVSMLNAANVPLLPVQETPSFGPFFIPDNSKITGINLYYITRTAVPTKVYFGIVGDMDWARSDSTPVKIHKMRFSDMEESASYRFETGDGDKGHLRTIPYGGEYEFSFAVGIIGRLKGLSPDKIRFLILLNKRGRLSLKEWAGVYQKNRALLSSTIIVPVFSWRNSQMDSHLFNRNYATFRYKHCRFLVLRSEGLNPAKFSKFLSRKPKERSYVIIDFMSREETMRYYSYFATRADVVLSPLKSEGWINLDKPKTFHEIKKLEKKLVLK